MKEVWAIRTRLEMEKNNRNLALFNLALDSKLRGCDLVRLKVGDIASRGDVKERATIIQKKTGRPVIFEITNNTRKSIKMLLREYRLQSGDYLFQSRLCISKRLSTRQYARIVQQWVGSIGLNPSTYGAHSLRRTKAALIYRKTGNLRTVQLQLGRTKLESTVRYLDVDVDVDDALEISSGIDF